MRKNRGTAYGVIGLGRFGTALAIALAQAGKEVIAIDRSEEKIKNLSDEELSALTEQFKSRYSDGESLESLMPEAFAAICEADYRVLGKRPYDVQILAAAALHGGYLAEMNTGEGKTLAATMPLYLNSLTGKSCMLVTTNDYLASRDGMEMGEVYSFMGLTCSYPDADDSKTNKKTNEERKKFYLSLIHISEPTRH